MEDISDDKKIIFAIGLNLEIKNIAVVGAGNIRLAFVNEIYQNR